MSTSVSTGDTSILTQANIAKAGSALALLILLFRFLSGRWDWWAGWAFLTVFALYSFALAGWLARSDPALARERQHTMPAGAEGWDRIIVPIMVVLELLLLVVAALDAGRFRWSAVPWWAQLAGWAGLILAGAMLPWVFRTNTYASSVARLQAERQHAVVRSGPYRLVRHPMYAAAIVGVLALPLALGSAWAEVAAVMLAILFVVRTALEDRMLREKLPGYEAYTQDVHALLLPGVW